MLEALQQHRLVRVPRGRDSARAYMSVPRVGMGGQGMGVSCLAQHCVYGGRSELPQSSGQAQRGSLLPSDWPCPMLTARSSLPLLQSPEMTLSQKIRAKLQNPDLLELCHSVPKEVIQLGKTWGGQDGQ